MPTRCRKTVTISVLCRDSSATDISTAMIYTHVLNKPGLAICSPLDDQQLTGRRPPIPRVRRNFLLILVRPKSWTTTRHQPICATTNPLWPRSTIGPTFHDSPVLAFTRAEPPKDTIALEVQAWEMTDEADARGYFVTLKHHLVHFAFSDIVKTDLEQNKANKAIM